MWCSSCASDLDHCHGTLVRHVDGLVECTDPCGNQDELRHSQLLDCAVVEDGCECRLLSLVASG